MATVYLLVTIAVAASAPSGDSATETTVTLGAYNQETIQQGIIQISKNFKFHNNFWTDSYGRPHNDIALIKLPQPVQLSNTINIVDLPSRYDIGQKFIGKYAKTSGWGNTDSQNSHVSEDLKTAIMQVVDNYYCDLVPSNDNFVLCAVGVNGISCSGDSGGPLVLDGVQIGIESFFGTNTDGSCLLKYPAVYMRITNYLEWIQANSDVEIILLN